MLVLEGSQGQGKSLALQTLAVRDHWFSDDLPLNAETKRQMEALSGRWIVEASELKGMKHGELEHLKSFLSRGIDHARLAYQRLETEMPRQCVIIGTTNSSAYLRDSTGNRRFWPIRTGRIDLDALKVDRDQLWAEAVAGESEGASIRLDPSLYETAGQEQAERKIQDPWVAVLEGSLRDLKGKIRVKDVWAIVGVEPGHQTQNQNARLGETMQELGWMRKRLRFDGTLEYAYVRGNTKETAKPIWVRRDGERVTVCTEHNKSAEASF